MRSFTWRPATMIIPQHTTIRDTTHRGKMNEPGGASWTEPSRSLYGGQLRCANPRRSSVMAWKYRKLISNIGNVFQALVTRNGNWRPLVAAAEAEAPTVNTVAVTYISEAEGDRCLTPASP